MTSFRTEIQATPASFSIDLQDRLLTMGSCFADQIGQKLFDYKFPTLANPLGTVYNPISIHQNLLAALQEKVMPNGLVQRDLHWFHFDFHSRWSGVHSDNLINQLNQRLTEVKSHLRQTQVIFLTYGTAWVYERLENDTIVANCHKMPAVNFRKRLLRLEEIIQSFQEVMNQLYALQPAIKIILTVSPVRHVKDTLPLNAVSKSLLRVACHQLTMEHQNVHYFPAYEILIDDLRDYRFYDRDLIHPNEVAVDYLWEKFSDTYFAAVTKDFIKEWDSIKNALHHRPFLSGSESHQKFLLHTLKQLQNLSNTVDVRKEIQLIQSQLTSTNANQ